MVDAIENQWAGQVVTFTSCYESSVMPEEGSFHSLRWRHGICIAE